MSEFDSPWKEALDRYFEAFLAFFFPQAHREIDWARGYEMLDKELQQVVREAELGRHLADKLARLAPGRPGGVGAGPRRGAEQGGRAVRSPHVCLQLSALRSV